MSMRFIYKFAKNLNVGDYVVPAGGEPMMHCYWKCIEVNDWCVRFMAAGMTMVADLNEVFLIRPDAPRHIRPELFAQVYGPGGEYYPWPYDYKNKTEWELRTEIGEDMSADVYRKWQFEAYAKKKELKIERPELVIRTMHDRAVRDFYSDQDSVSDTEVLQEDLELVGGSVSSADVGES